MFSDFSFSLAIRSVALATVLGCICLIVPAAHAHPFHVCVGQMHWNEESKLWEVSLRMHPQDLERAMKAWRTSAASKSLSDSELIALQRGCSIEDKEFENVVVEFLSREFFLVKLPMGQSDAEARVWVKKADQEEAPKSTLAWLGKESEKGWLWLHFEMRPPTKPTFQSELWVCNRIFLETIDRQENSLAIQSSSREKFSMLFKKESAIQRFRKPSK